MEWEMVNHLRLEAYLSNTRWPEADMSTLLVVEIVD
jgi:hypothetical protein